MHSLLAILAVASFMTVAVAAYLFYMGKSGEITLRSYSVSIIFLTMMASMFNSFSYFLATSYSFLNTIIAVNFSMIAMTVAIVHLLWHVSSPRKRGYGTRSRLLISSLLVWNEASMGVLLYQMASVSHPSVYGLQSVLYLISSGVNSPFFVVPMFLEMIVSLLVFRNHGIRRIALFSIAFMSLLSSSMIPGLYLYLLAGQTVVMIVFMIWMLELVSSGKHTIKPQERRVVSLSFLISALMMLSNFAGFTMSQAFWVSWLPYSIAMLAGMGVYFSQSLSTSGATGTKGWLKSPWFVFSILLLSFIAELFLSATILFVQSGISARGIAAMISFSDYLGGVNVFTPASDILDVFYIIGTVTSGFWFLLLMGIEMGSLVIFRIRSIKWKEKRVNLILALIAFAVYTTYIPAAGPRWISSYLPVWANVGSLGPVYPGVIVAVILSYVFYAALAVLFGRRSYCSTLCPSAVMYGGTLGQQMISYNYESGISRKNLGSTYKAPILTVVYNSWIVLFVASSISYFSHGITGFTLYGVDTAVFFSLFVWNFLWYLFFFSIPFVGMSPCRRYGWCSTGTFVGFFSMIGLFRLKVKSPQTCVTCKTKDCVTACEVGLADLPGQFIKRGYFKSSKCVGSGSCIQACPYDNIFFYDVRNYLRERKK